MEAFVTTFSWRRNKTLVVIGFADLLHLDMKFELFATADSFLNAIMFVTCGFAATVA